ncbi:excise [Gordonia phage VanLee]|uniref:Excise n=1 Tax=Gordonia phage VanLee TaxID=2845816 RepID=A0A8F2IFG6_9CAUD|nr:excise [Gordonia phage VanLee]QWS68157.1 excise [Gordonia phage VanLee]
MSRPASVTLSEIMSTRQLAEHLDITPGHIRDERVKGGHPLFSKGFLMGGRLYFAVADVEEYKRSCGCPS